MGRGRGRGHGRGDWDVGLEDVGLEDVGLEDVGLEGTRGRAWTRGRDKQSSMAAHDVENPLR